MMGALAAIAGGTTAALVGLVAWLVYKLLRARDLLDEQDEQLDEVTDERDALIARLAGKDDEISKEKALRLSAESQRNEALNRGVSDVVEKIKAASVDERQRILAELLAGMPQAVPEGRATAPGPDALIDPEL